jgi:hypothetical protein
MTALDLACPPGTRPGGQAGNRVGAVARAACTSMVHRCELCPVNRIARRHRRARMASFKGMAVDANFTDGAALLRHLQNSWKLRVCPKCGRSLPSDAYGTGSVTDGYFCSTECVSQFWYGPDGRRRHLDS